jgi:ATP-binding cassette subfamily F protein 3
MIQLRDLGISFGGKWLFRNLQWHIAPDARVGLVGPNGAGKTTILRIISGLLPPETGQVLFPKKTTFGYLPQEGIIHSGRTLFDEAYSALEDIVSLQEQMASVQKEMESARENSPELDDLLKHMGHLEHRMQVLEAYTAESRVHKILKGLGFSESDETNPVETFSGGWQMRIALAKLLLSQPDVLLLDEPTNHLDIPSLEWLETYLREYDGTVILVSHDRFFLDQATNVTAEIEHGILTIYHGNYSLYESEKEERLERLSAEQYRLGKEKERVERFVERFRYKATKAKAVQSRIKMLEKMKDIEVPTHTKAIHFRFPEAPRSGRIVFEAAALAKSYDSKLVFKGLDLILERGRRVALVGPNGAGKSTLCRIVTGSELPTQGSFRLGHNVLLGSFSQDVHYELDPESTVLLEVESSATIDQLPHLRSLLGAFLFSGDDVDKKVKVLSGGEKSRLALAKILLKPSNLLVLDEPTNHLDRSGREVLLNALKTYRGTILVVSHDRHFLDGLVNEIWEINDQTLRIFPGNYSDYHRIRMEEQEKAILHEKKEIKPVVADDIQIRKSTAGRKTKEQKRLEAEERQRKFQHQQKFEAQLKKVLSDIERRENRKSELEVLLSDAAVYRDGDRARDILKEYQKIQSELLLLYDEWEKIEKKSTIETPKIIDKTVDKNRQK